MKKAQKYIKNILDRILALLAIVCLSPIMIVAAVGIKASSKGPIIYKAQRMGYRMKPFTVYKFRSMHVGMESMGAITGASDSRVFKWGELLRKTKVDELPQLFNILTGSMSIIGPRPEDIYIVEDYYNDEEKKTLLVLPGLACPGSIYNYTHGEKYLSAGNATEIYVKKLLHVKLALDLYYLEHWSLLYDVSLIFRTIYSIVLSTLGAEINNYPYEYLKVYGDRDVIDLKDGEN